MGLTRPRIRFVRTISAIDLFLLIGVSLFVYAMIGLARNWTGPFRPKIEIELGILPLVKYSFYSLVRVSIAYLISLGFTIGYGYVAAKSRVAEPILIPLLDILQSVPVVAFMPGLVLALVNLFPHSNLGLEIAAVLLIFTGEGWNMVFSFYSSLKGIPQELHELTRMCRLKKREVLRTVELPYAMNGLVWNSMLSMAGGWFFLMMIESFTLGEKDFRLPGIGSYMAVAYERHDMGAIVLGITAMFALIILVDRCIWAPAVVWSERFKFDMDSHGQPHRSLVLEWLKRSRLMANYLKLIGRVAKALRSKKLNKVPLPAVVVEGVSRAPKISLGFVAVILVGISLIFSIRSVYQFLVETTSTTWLLHIRDTFYTLLRVAVAVILGSLWTIPVGVFIGTHPKWTRRLEPVVQVVASFPGPMLFPMITFVLLKCGIKLEFGAAVLMLFASQWYILFNVISGTTLIPQQILDVTRIFHVRGWEYWRAIILPAIFPSLVNGWITAAGGAWNASIVSEIVQYGSGTLTATGIGASITQAAQAGDFPKLAAGIVVMVVTVVLLNRLFWGALYRLAETRFKWDA